jgi:hypothetical protein
MATTDNHPPVDNDEVNKALDVLINERNPNVNLALAERRI